MTKQPSDANISMEHIESILSRLSKWDQSKTVWGQAASAKVFGSVARASIKPGDVDFMLEIPADPGDHPSSLKHGHLNQLLALAIKHYGYFDPFVCFTSGKSKTLWVRSDDARSWIRARHGNELIKDAAMHGVDIQKADQLYQASKGGGNLTLPLLKFDRLHHVGTFDRAHKATTHNRCSLEGGGLSVSKHPEAWRKIARLGDSPTWAIEAKQAPIALIDAHAMNAQQWARVTAWANAHGLIEPTKSIRVSWMDDEMGDVCHMEFDLKQPGKTEIDIETEARLEYEDRIDCEGKIETVDAWQSTPAMNERLGWSVDSSLARDMALTFFAEDIAFASDGIAGVWWGDELNVACYSAPRGVIHQGALDTFECEVVQAVDLADEMNDEDENGPDPSSRRISP